MRWVALIACVAVIACSDDSANDVADAKVMDATAADASADECQASVTMCREGREVAFAELCFRNILPPGSKPSAGLYSVCNVNAAGELYLSMFAGDTYIGSDGWTHSSYGGGNITSTLSAADEARCAAAKDAARSDPPDSGLCSRLKF